MQISIFGNPDLDFDSLPLQILPQLKVKFPEIEFKIQDPNELDIPIQDKWIIIDTVKGLKKVQIVSIDKISDPTTRATVHDFDLTIHLKLIKKIKKDINIIIIGIPMSYDKNKAFEQSAILVSILISENEKRSSYTDHKRG